MITSVHINPSASKQFKHLALTSSVDWSIKLWNINDISMAATPLLEFTASTFDYFCSVRWSHSHPGVFSCITSGKRLRTACDFAVLMVLSASFVVVGGILMLWNICQSVLEPVGTLKITSSDKHTELASASHATGCALNKSVWLDDGRKLLVGDSKYVIAIFF
jgi:WD40 repeat protein